MYLILTLDAASVSWRKHENPARKDGLWAESVAEKEIKSLFDKEYQVKAYKAEEVEIGIQFKSKKK